MPNTLTEPKPWPNSCSLVLVHYLPEVHGLGVLSFICDLREALSGYYHVLFLSAERMNENLDQQLLVNGLDVRYLDRPLRQADLEAVGAAGAILWDAAPTSFDQDIFASLPKVLPSANKVAKVWAEGDSSGRRHRYAYYTPAAEGTLSRQDFPPYVSEALLLKQAKRVSTGRTVVGFLAGRPTMPYFSLVANILQHPKQRNYTPLVMNYPAGMQPPEYTLALQAASAREQIMLCPYRLGAVREALYYTSLVVSQDYRIQAEAGLMGQAVLPITPADQLQHTLKELAKDRRRLEKLVLDSRLLGGRRSLELYAPRLEKLLR